MITQLTSSVGAAEKCKQLDGKFRARQERLISAGIQYKTASILRRWRGFKISMTFNLKTNGVYQLDVVDPRVTTQPIPKPVVLAGAYLFSARYKNPCAGFYVTIQRNKVPPG